MNKLILKAVFGGIAFGALVFFAGPFILLILILKFIFTPFGMGRMWYMRHAMGYEGWGRHAFVLADKVRNMSEEEYQEFQNKMKAPYGGCHSYVNNSKDSTI